MTNAIEQSKREMYARLADLKQFVRASQFNMKEFEESMEKHLELLRQDLSALHETARKRFEDIQSLEAVNEALQMKNENQRIIIEEAGGTNELRYRLSEMTAERDSLRNRMQASDHAQGEGATVHQSSAENASCANSGGHTAILVTAIDLCKRQVELWGFQEVKAKKAMRRIARVVNGDPDLANALRAASSSDGYGTWFINNTQCMHSFHPAFPSGEQCVFCGVGK